MLPEEAGTARVRDSGPGGEVLSIPRGLAGPAGATPVLVVVLHLLGLLVGAAAVEAWVAVARSAAEALRCYSSYARGRLGEAWPGL